MCIVFEMPTQLEETDVVQLTSLVVFVVVEIDFNVNGIRFD